MRHLWRRSPTFLMGLALLGCASMAPTGPTGGVTLTLRPSLIGPRATQAVVSPYTAASIQRLDVVPYVEVAANIFQPIKASSGEPTTEGDLQLLKSGQSSPSIDLDRPIFLSNLKPHERYRIYARAYAADGTLISTDDAYSYAEVTLTNDDRPSMAATLPLKLVDRSFAAATRVTVKNSGGSGYDEVVATLFKAVNGSEEVVTSQTIAKTDIPRTLQLTGLESDTLYRLEVSARKTASEVATASATIAVGRDDAPASQSIAFNAPPNYVVSTYVTERLNTPRGAAVDSNGVLYVANTGSSNILKFVDGVYQTFVASGLAAPHAVAVDDQGTLYVPEFSGGLIRAFSPRFLDSYYWDEFQNPVDVFMDSAQNLYVLDRFDGTVKVKETRTGASWFAASGLQNPRGVAADANGNVFATEDAGNVLKFTPGGVKSTLASGLAYPTGLTVDPAGNVLVATQGAIKRISPTGVVTTLAGSETPGHADGAALEAMFYAPDDIVRTPDGVLYVVDTGNHAIRRIDP